MILVIYRLSNGEIFQSIHAPLDELLSYEAPTDCGCAVVEAGVSGETHYFDAVAGEPVAIPERPSFDHRWDAATHQWMVTVEGAKARRLSELRSKREAVINGTFSWNSLEFDSDATAQTRLMGMYVSAVNTPGVFPVSWRLADNSWASLSAADALGVWASLQQHIENSFVTFAMHEAAINALTLVEEVQQYDISTNW